MNDADNSQHGTDVDLNNFRSTVALMGDHVRLKLDAAEARGIEALITKLTKECDQYAAVLAEIQSFHREKHGENDHGPYVICDYDKTQWPCRTQLTLDRLAIHLTEGDQE
jgi:hypothetical protein